MADEITALQTELLQALDQKGAATPLEIAVQKLLPAKEVELDLEVLEHEGYVSSRDMAPGQKAMFLSEKGRKAARR